MKHHGQKRRFILLIILRKTLVPFLLGALFLAVPCILSEARGHPVPDNPDSTQTVLPENPLHAEYRIALQALRSGLLDSSASLSRQILRSATASQDSDYVVKAAILLGNIASREQDYALGRRYYALAARFATKEDDRFRIAGNQALLLQIEENYQAAIDSFKQVISQTLKAGFPSLAAAFTINLSGCYTNAGKNDSALLALKETIAWAERLQDPDLALSAFVNIGATYANQGLYDSALAYFRRSLPLAAKAENASQYAVLAYNLSDIFLQKNLFDSAYFYLREYEEFDSLLQQPLSARQYQDYAKTTSELAENRIKIAEQEAELRGKQATIVILCISTVALFLLLAFFIAIEHRKRSQQYALLKEAENRQLKQELEYKQQTDRLQKEKIEQKTKELASYALLLSNKNRLLKKLDGFLSEQDEQNWQENQRKARHEIKENLHTEDDYWKLFVKHFTSVDSAFLDRLAQRFPTLNKNETRLCAYIRIGMTTKQIASIQNISPLSANQNRYLLRKKLGLKNGDDLDKIIKSL